MRAAASTVHCHESRYRNETRPDAGELMQKTSDRRIEEFRQPFRGAAWECRRNAVSVEVFFENPVRFRHELTTLYEALAKTLNQDPITTGAAKKAIAA